MYMSAPINEATHNHSFVPAYPRRVYSTLMTAWTLLIVFLVWAGARYVEQVYARLLYVQASTSCERDLLFRSWVAKFGGVYAPVVHDKADPHYFEANKRLHHPRRDVMAKIKGDENDDPRELTLINSNWMLRQITEMQPSEHRVISRLTSRHLMNKANAPNDWERNALDMLETRRQPEKFDILRDKDDHYKVRFARPLEVVQGCLDCHGYQGYQVGDIRGIISVEIGADSEIESKRRVLLVIYCTGIGIWVCGFSCLVYSRMKLHTTYEANLAAWNTLLKKEEIIRQHKDELATIALNFRMAKESAEDSRGLVENANKAKNQFLATMSEIRTPLRRVIGVSDLLLNTSLQPEQLEYAHLIKFSGESLLSLINGTFDFSKIEAEKLEIEEFAVHDDSGSEKTPPKPTIRVLVVDDNKVNRIVVAAILKHAEMDCVIVDSGIAAVDIVKREHFDIVLMDCQMPVMDGYEATINIRQWEKDVSLPTRIPIMALTANIAEEDVQRCFDVGMDGYCSKPVNPTLVLKEMERVLEAHKQRKNETER